MWSHSCEEKTYESKKQMLEKSAKTKISKNTKP